MGDIVAQPRVQVSVIFAAHDPARTHHPPTRRRGLARRCKPDRPCRTEDRPGRAQWLRQVQPFRHAAGRTGTRHRRGPDSRRLDRGAHGPADQRAGPPGDRIRSGRRSRAASGGKSRCRRRRFGRRRTHRARPPAVRRCPRLRCPRARRGAAQWSRLRRGRARKARRRVLRRLAHPAEPGARADVPVGPADARRADQPPGSRDHHLAGGMAQTLRRHAGADLARPGLPRQRRRRHRAYRAPAAQPLCRRLQRFRAPARRTHGAAAGAVREAAEEGRPYAVLRRPVSLQGVQSQAGPGPPEGARADGEDRSGPRRQPLRLRVSRTRPGRRPADGDVRVLEGISLNLAAGDRIGLLGVNGAGKSTLVKALAGELEPQAGTLEASRNLRIGYFAQHQMEQIDRQASPLVNLSRIAGDTPEQKLRDFLGGFAFSGDLATDPCTRLSGGERARLVLALIIWKAPNLLLLDEPTNHLDLEMRHALTVALQGFEGAVVTVSHDRHLLASTVDEYWLVADGGVRPFDGGLEAYRKLVSQPDTGGGKGTASGNRKAERQRKAAARERVKPLANKVKKLTVRIEQLEAEHDRLQKQLADADLYQPDKADELNRLLAESGTIKQKLESLEGEWLEAEEELEALRAG